MGIEPTLRAWEAPVLPLNYTRGTRYSRGFIARVKSNMFKIVFYVPPSHLETVKTALFERGGGRIGNYSHCAWEVLGEGQYMPLKNSHPYHGTLHKIERVQEYKVEMVCEDNLISEVIEALKKSHPYEEPAYQIIKLEN